VSERAEYAAVGAAMRQAWERAATHRVTACDLATLGAVCARVTSYSRLEDKLTAKEIAGCTHFHYRSVLTSLKRLASLRPPVLIFEPARGQKKRSLIGLHPSASVSEGLDAHSPSAEVSVQRLTQSEGLEAHSECTSGHSPSEKYSEKVFETDEKPSIEEVQAVQTMLRERGLLPVAAQ
jgi:hypothetical protein